MSSGLGAVPSVAGALPGLLQDVRRRSERVDPLLVSGPPGPVAELRRAFVAGGDPALVRVVGIADLRADGEARGAALAHAVDGDVTAGDEAILRAAERRRLPIVVLVLTDAPVRPVLPYVAATDVVWSPSLDAAAIDALASRIARRADEAWALAAKLPVLRLHAVRALVRGYARQNALGAFLSASEPAPPALTLNQLRMTFRLAAAQGTEPAGAPGLWLAAAVGAGLGLGALAGRAVEALPPGLEAPLKAAVAYAGTRALAEAALVSLERQAPARGAVRGRC